MLFTLKAKIPGHVISASAETAKEVFAKAVEWQVAQRMDDGTISDGRKDYSIAEFSAEMARSEIAATRQDFVTPSEPSNDPSA